MRWFETAGAAFAIWAGAATLIWLLLFRGRRHMPDPGPLLPSAPVEHYCTVVEALIPETEKPYTAVCTCGWEGRASYAKAAAELDAALHEMTAPRSR